MMTKAEYLKLSLDSGVIVIENNCNLELNRATTRYTMTGDTGQHSLSANSSARRILMHWTGFVRSNVRAAA